MLHKGKRTSLANFLLLSLLLLILPMVGFGQSAIPLGSWQVHPSPYSLNLLLNAGNKIYAANNNTIFSINTDDFEVEIFSKLKGLSDVGITAISYNTQEQILIIGYNSGNIDLLLNDGSIFNINALVRSSFSGSKRISHINNHRGNAYIAGDFGLLLLNLRRREVSASNTSLGGNAVLGVNKTLVFNDSLYLLMRGNAGIRSLSLNDNLQNTNRYRVFGVQNGIPLVGTTGLAEATQIATLNNQLFVHFSNAGTGNEGLFVKEGNRFRNANIQSFFGRMPFLRATPNGDTLLAIVNDRILKMGSDFQVKTISDTSFFALTEADIDAKGRTWFAQFARQLRYLENGAFSETNIQGPLAEVSIQGTSYGNKIAFASGGYDTRFYGKLGFRFGIAEYSNETGWEIVNFLRRPIRIFEDAVHIAYDERSRKQFISLWGGGLLIRNPDGTEERFDQGLPANSTLRSVVAGSVGFTRIAASAVDLKGDLFIANFTFNEGLPGLHQYNFRTKEFTAINGINPFGDAFQSPLDIVVTNNNDKWMRAAPTRNNVGAVWVVGDNGTQRIISNRQGTGALPSPNVNDIAKDIDGAMWLATDRGLAVFFSPSTVIRNQSYNAVLPIFDGRPILEQEATTAIAIDAGGRKWVGTRTGGVFLFDKDLNKNLLQFNESNSPLLSNNILDIVIKKDNGEVFFLTDRGIISYRTEATDPSADGSELKVFPNPVPPNYEGLLGIQGLPANSTVKITDVAGRKVYEAPSVGGGLSWNLRDYNNRRAKTGIYLIFAITEEGEEKAVGKFAVVE